MLVDEFMNWMKLTHLLSSFSLNLTDPFCTSTFTSYFLIVVLDVQTKELNTSCMYIMFINVANNTSPLCILCMLMPQIIPLLILTLVCTWYEESTPSPPREQCGDIRVVVGLQGAFCHAVISHNMFFFKKK